MAVLKILPKIEQLASLLEQCILYNSPEYRPFTGKSCLAQPGAQESGSEVTETQTTKHENKTEAGDPPTSPKAVTSLLNIDLNFDVAIDEYVTRIVIPRYKTTNRRTVCKCKAETKHYSTSPYAYRAKTRQKPILDHKTPKLVQANLSKPNTSAPQFLTLPGEVREAIYAQIFAGARVYISQKPPRRHAFDHYPAIRSTCKTIRAEAARAYFNSLTIKIIYQTLRKDDDTETRDSIPPQVTQQLQSLVVMARDDAFKDLDSLKLVAMPSLRVLTFVQTGYIHWTDPRQLQLHLMGLLMDLKEKTLPTSRNWLSELLQTTGRKYLVKWEKEDLSRYTKDRATHMGSLSKDRYNTVLISFSEDKQGVFVEEHLSISRIRERKEMYYWMAKDAKEKTRANMGGDVASTIGWLDNVEYHATLDRIEAGVTKTMDKAVVTDGDVKPADAV